MNPPASARSHGRKALEEAREIRTNAESRNTLQDYFQRRLVIRLGDKTVHNACAGPGPDVCVVHVREEKVLFASDLMMPVPVIASPLADIEKFKQSLHSLHEFNLETIVQGHGDILLRGEVTPSIEEGIKYLNEIEELVDRLLTEGATRRELLSNDIEKFGRNPYPWAGWCRTSTRQIWSICGKRQGRPQKERPHRLKLLETLQSPPRAARFHPWARKIL